MVNVVCLFQLLLLRGCQSRPSDLHIELGTGFMPHALPDATLTFLSSNLGPAITIVALSGSRSIWKPCRILHLYFKWMHLLKKKQVFRSSFQKARKHCISTAQSYTNQFAPHQHYKAIIILKKIRRSHPKIHSMSGSPLKNAIVAFSACSLGKHTSV